MQRLAGFCSLPILQSLQRNATAPQQACGKQNTLLTSCINAAHLQLIPVKLFSHTLAEQVPAQIAAHAGAGQAYSCCGWGPLGPDTGKPIRDRNIMLYARDPPAGSPLRRPMQVQ